MRHPFPLEFDSLNYYENGNLYADYNHKDGKVDGPGKFYYESGNLKKEYNYKDGKLDGFVKIYDESGMLNGEVSYKNGKHAGPAKIYGENGKFKITIFNNFNQQLKVQAVSLKMEKLTEAEFENAITEVFRNVGVGTSIFARNFGRGTALTIGAIDDDRETSATYTAEGKFVKGSVTLQRGGENPFLLLKF